MRKLKNPQTKSILEIKSLETVTVNPESLNAVRGGEDGGVVPVIDFKTKP